MGKPTGFMENERNENKLFDPLVRSYSFEEFHIELEESERVRQASRCMNCGVPYCSSGAVIENKGVGCPLENDIPEFNDLVFKKKYREAYEFLSDHSPFPEFTGRVCPALCEAACTNKECGFGSTTNKDTELFIIEEAFRKGYVTPSNPKRNGKRVAVIGSGPSGLSCAYYLNEMGYEVTVFEKEDRAGGLLMYGIPNMKLDKSIIERRIDVLKKSGISFVLNKEIKTIDEINEFDAIAFAGGTDIQRDLNVKGRDANGIIFAIDYLKSATKSLLDGTPSPLDLTDKNVIVVGGGDTGNDCVSTSLRLKCKSVEEIEIMPKAPLEMPYPFLTKTSKMDYSEEEAIARFGRSPKIYSTSVKEIVKDRKGDIKSIKTTKVRWEGRNFLEIPGSEEEHPCDLLVISMGFIGTSSEIAKSKMPNAFILGDAKTGPSLVVKAIRSGKDGAYRIDEYLKGR